MKVIIADDSVLMRERIKYEINLFKEVVLCGEASNGREALEMIVEINPDLVFLDIRMPEMNGIEVLSKIREYNVETKICILTNYASPQYKERCIEDGADFFLSKIDDFEKISIVIADVLKEIGNSSQISVIT